MDAEHAAEPHCYRRRHHCQWKRAFVQVTDEQKPLSAVMTFHHHVLALYPMEHHVVVQEGVDDLTMMATPQQQLQQQERA